MSSNNPMPGATSDSFWFKYALTCAAATVAETVTYPLDLTKTRLQIQGERLYLRANKSANAHGSLQYRGMFRTAVGIVQEEGLAKLWQGVSPAILRHYIYTGVRIVGYEQIREKVFGGGREKFPLWQALLAGALSGMIAQFLASPADLIKVQMQMEGRRRLEGFPPRVKTLWQTFRMLLKQGGVLGLWKGVVPNVQRAALVNMADLATYDKVKHALLAHTKLEDNYLTHSLSSACSGFAAAVASTPADVVKTRVMNQPLDASGTGMLYSSSIDCFMKTVKQEGFLALYKGFVPIYVRMAPWSLTFWLSYEKIRSITGATSF